MEEWCNKKIKEICIVGRGRVINQNEIKEKPGIYPVYSSQSQNKGEMGKIDSYDFNGEYVTWTTDGAYAGTVFYRNGKFNCTNVCGTLKAKDEDSLNMNFLAYLLSTNAKKHVSYLGNPKLMNGVMSEIDLVLPRLRFEQSKIAEILTKADEAISNTETLILKYQRIKIGLLQDLLTMGIDEKGNIRSKKTHKFVVKNGIEVPKEWDVELLDNIVSEVLDFKANGSFETLTENVKYYYEQNYARLIRLTDLRNGLKNEGVYIDQKGFQFLKKTRLVEGDILIACVGEYTGFVCQMPKIPYQSTIAPNMFVVRFKSNIINSFAARYMTSSQFQNQVSIVSTSSATKLLNNPNLRSLKLVIPNKEEQILIANRIDSVDLVINDYTESLKKLNTIKTGLMQDLLSGKVRVKINEEVRT